MPWPRSLRWRVALYSALLVAVALGAVGALIAVQVEDALIDAAEEHLHALVRPALLTPGASGRTEDNPSRVAASLARSLAEPMRWIVLDAAGAPVRVEGRGTEATGRVLAGAPYAAALADARPRRLISGGTPDEPRMLHALIPLGAGRGTTGLVQVSAPLAETDALLGVLRGLVLGGILLALAAAMLIGIPLVRLAMRPLDRMLATVRRIAAGDLSQRVHVSASSGELGELAAAFDAMLDRVESTFDALRQSEERTKRFAADASHELRSPLTALGGYTDLLLAEASLDPVGTERALLAMRREVDRMSRLVADLLVLARLDAAAPGRRELVDLSAVAREAAQHASVLADGPTVIAHPADPLLVVGDPDELRRLVGNLVANAVRHTPRGGSVEIETARHAGTAVLRVRDTGEGIPGEYLPFIFDRFYRPDPSRGRPSGSAGLGLALVRAIAQAHGGQVEVESAVGAGSTFSVELPLAAAERPSQRLLSEPQAASTQALMEGSGPAGTVVSRRSK